MDTATARNGVTAIVEYDYTAKEPDELDLVKGAIIHSIKQMPGGWWEGTLKTNGKTGMFPDNFVRVIDTTTSSAADESNVTLRDKSATKNRRCKVIYSYAQVNDDELSLAVGDVIEFLGEVEEGWWRGRLKTKIGVFPSNFVVEIEPSPVLASKRPITATAATISKSSAVNSSTLTTTNTNTSATTASALANAALAAVTTKKSNRLSFHNSKEDILNNTTTSTTSSSSSLLTTTAASSSSSSSAATVSALPPPAYDDVVMAPVLPPKPQREYCRVEFPYAPQNDDELELKVGDVITIISMELPDKGWWKGELRGKIGVFPDNFVKLLAPPDVIPSANDAPQQQQTQQIHSQKTAKTFVSGISSSTTNATTNILNSSNATSSTAAATQSQSSVSTANASTSKVFIKKSGSTSSTQSSNRKDSFGSYDSLNDILSETGLQTGNVAAQRKSLENKNLDLSNAPDAGIRMGLKKQQQESTSKTAIASSNNSSITTSNSSTNTAYSSLLTTTSELRKSLENMDEKASKTTPPPVLTKKPNVPTKKSTTVTSVAANLLNSLKTKVKNVENTLTTSVSTDAADGIGSSKMSPPSGGVLPDAAPSGNVVMRRAATIAVEDSDFDRVERTSILTDMRAGRVKAPKRRPPSAAINAIGESNNNSIYLNGSSEVRHSTTDSFDESARPHSSDDNSTSEEHLAKPKPREWEKKKAPWMEELKASQVKKKTSPNVEPRTDVKPTTNTVSNATTKVQSSTVTSTQQAMMFESSVHQIVKKEHEEHSSSSSSTTTTSSSNNVDIMSKSLSGKLTDITNSNPNAVDDLRAARPNSLSIRNRNISSSQLGVSSTADTRSVTKSATSSSASPGDSLSKNATATTATATTTTHSSTAAKKITNQHVNNHHQHHATSHHHHHHNPNAATATTTSHANHSDNDGRIVELERRIEKLETVVHTQQRTIDELVRTLREETDRVKVLRGELDKYAQCVTQV